MGHCGADRDLPLNTPKDAKSEPDGHLSDLCHLTSDLWPIGVISRVSRIALGPSAQRLLVSVPCKILCEKSKPILTFSFIASIAKQRWSRIDRPEE